MPQRGYAGSKYGATTEHACDEPCLACLGARFGATAEGAKVLGACLVLATVTAQPPKPRYPHLRFVFVPCNHGKDGYDTECAPNVAAVLYLGRYSI